MRALSISAAWEESRAILVRDGQLFIAVALALIVFPSAVSGLVNPRGLGTSGTPLWIDLLTIVASLIGLAGQLAMIRLALGRSVSVGEAITHGLRRLPVYFFSVLLVVTALLIVAVPLGFVLAAMGISVQPNTSPPPGLMVAGLLYAALVCFVLVRMILAAPVASGEPAGPITIIRRSWSLTAGHWWPLFGFLLLFIVAAIIVLLAVASATGVVANLLFGSIQPMSASALVVALIQALVGAAITTLFMVMLARIYLQLSGRAEEVGEVFR
jgi:hypothetical protein